MLQRHFHTVWAELMDQNGQWRGLDDVTPFWAARNVAQAGFWPFARRQAQKKYSLNQYGAY